MLSCSIQLSRSKQNGFSLLEMLVAMVILGISLGVLYQAVAGSTRTVGMDEKYAYGVELAASLLADNAIVSITGLSAQGETEGGFSWLVEATPLNLAGSSLATGALQDIKVLVTWQDGGRERSVQLHSVVPGLDE